MRHHQKRLPDFLVQKDLGFLFRELGEQDRIPISEATLPHEVEQDPSAHEHLAGLLNDDLRLVVDYIHQVVDIVQVGWEALGRLVVVSLVYGADYRDAGVRIFRRQKRPVVLPPQVEEILPLRSQLEILILPLVLVVRPQLQG